MPASASIATPTKAPTKAYVGLGANLGDPPAQLRAALQGLTLTPGLALNAVSDFFRSAPLGPAGQPDYCNAVCALSCRLAPDALLDRLQALEREAGRVRGGERWGPRLLDLDLLYMEGMGEGVVLNTPRLTLPHPQMHRRNFVLAPLAQLAPDLVIPGLGSVRQLAAALGRDGMRQWGP